MSWFEIAAERQKHTMFVHDQLKEPSGGEDAYFLSFCVIFSECSVIYNESYDETSKNFVEAIKNTNIEIAIICPPDGVHNKTTIELRKSGVKVRIAMSHHDFLVFLSMLQSAVDSKIIRLSIPDPYPHRISKETLTHARDLLDGRAQESVHPDDKVEITLIGFELLFDN